MRNWIHGEFSSRLFALLIFSHFVGEIFPRWGILIGLPLLVWLWWKCGREIVETIFLMEREME
jgi:uncharacterized Tic20 family protein